MFFAGKLLAWITQPLSWVIALLVLAIMSRRRRPVWSRRFNLVALLSLLSMGWQPLPDALLRYLEQQHAAIAPDAKLGQFKGVIVLGGALESARIWEDNGQVALNSAAERMTMAVVLMRQDPRLLMLFSGGEGDLVGYGPSEANRAAVFFDSLGVAKDRIHYESASRTTHENAVLSASTPGIDATQPWLLLTSASHMPRAMASYQKAGWNVTAYPVDFRAGLHTPWWEYSLSQGAQRWQLALHELVGYIAYRIAGRV
ncbi:YdcF family protein [Rhodoferax sp.]|uniref:YdcF family protein n=1 Tax=Rhodoferax sp. TaxID=50421 RepID=UPI002749A43C|nr:YdcF family protein [Rhodoferax sp.]